MRTPTLFCAAALVGGTLGWTPVVHADVADSVRPARLAAPLLGPEWEEEAFGGEDAGNLPDTAQRVELGGTPVARIRGKLGAVDGAGGLNLGEGGNDDFEDMYRFRVDNPATFSATTVDSLGGMATFDTILYLFDEDGNPLLANDNAPDNNSGGGNLAAQGTETGSLLMNASTDGTGVVLLEPGEYLLAITIKPRGPQNPDGQLFVFGDDDEQSGPDGAGGDGMINGWNPDPGGACCFSEEGTPTCESAASLDDCQKSGGVFQGLGSICEDIDCAAALDLGPCCFGKGGCLDLTEAECNQQDGDFLDPDDNCSLEPCDAETGSCCFMGLPVGGGTQCTETNEDTCANMFGVFTPGGSCDDNPCSATGACCFAFSCTPDLTEAECTNAEGSWQGDDSTCFSCTLADQSGPPVESIVGNRRGGNAVVGATNYLIVLDGVVSLNNDCDEDFVDDAVQTQPDYDPDTAVAAGNCDNANFIGTGITYAGDTADIADGDTEALHCGPSFGLNDGWFSYRPTWTGSASVTGNSPGGGLLVIGIYDDCPDNGGSLISCNNTLVPTTFTAVAGATYYIRFAVFGIGTGPYEVTLNGPDELLNEDDANRNGIPDTCECLADVNGDGVVDTDDFLETLAMVGDDCDCPNDIDGSGTIDGADLGMILDNLGDCPEEPNDN